MLKKLTAIIMVLSILNTMLWAIPTVAEPAGASFSVQMPDKTTIKSELTVDVLLENNPGLGGAVIQLDFDSSVFTLTDVQQGALCIANGTALVQWAAGKTAVAIVADDTITGDGALVRLTFRVADTVTAGEYKIKVSSTELNDGTLQPFTAAPAEKTVDIADYIWGDANGDKKVDIADAQTILKWRVYLLSESELNMPAADADRNGVLGLPDAIILLQWMNQYVEWDPNGTTLPPVGI